MNQVVRHEVIVAVLKTAGLLPAAHVSPWRSGRGFERLRNDALASRPVPSPPPVLMPAEPRVERAS
eukprot:4945492-Alexandrium_andersonii.AAC.1